MHRIKKSNRRGAITVFLAIILSAIILVECTYVALVANYDRALTLRRAVDLQINTYLAQYDRQLLKTYGIYAFNINTIDSDVFTYVMEANGLSDGEILEVSGMQTFDTDDLRRAISYFYAYRTTGILFNSCVNTINSFFDSLDDNNILRRINRFMSSDAATIFMNILDGAVNITDTLESAAETLNLDDMVSSIHKFNRFISKVDDLFSGPLNSDDGFNPENLGFGIEAASRMEDFFGDTADVMDEYLFHPILVNYASFNFDCNLEDDSALDGTTFDVFHEGNEPDLEYILTGLSSEDAIDTTENYIYMLLVIKNIVGVFTDENLRTTISTIANILSIIVDIISAGAVILPSNVYEAFIIGLYGLIYAADDLDDVRDGDRVSLTNIEGPDQVTLGYRDFVSLFLFFNDDDEILNRITEIINRDFSGYVTGISIVGSCNSCSEYEISRGYLMYE